MQIMAALKPDINFQFYGCIFYIFTIKANFFTQLTIRINRCSDLQVYNKDVYSLSVIVKELRNVELIEPEERQDFMEPQEPEGFEKPDPQYQTILLAFINCIISDEECLDKTKLRNELNGM